MIDPYFFPVNGKFIEPGLRIMRRPKRTVGTVGSGETLSIQRHAEQWKGGWLASMRGR